MQEKWGIENRQNSFLNKKQKRSEETQNSNINCNVSGNNIDGNNPPDYWDDSLNMNRRNFYQNPKISPENASNNLNNVNLIDAQNISYKEINNIRNIDGNYFQSRQIGAREDNRGNRYRNTHGEGKCYTRGNNDSDNNKHSNNNTSYYNSYRRDNMKRRDFYKKNKSIDRNYRKRLNSKRSSIKSEDKDLSNKSKSYSRSSQSSAHRAYRNRKGNKYIRNRNRGRSRSNDNNSSQRSSSSSYNQKKKKKESQVSGNVNNIAISIPSANISNQNKLIYPTYQFNPITNENLSFFYQQSLFSNPLNYFTAQNILQQIQKFSNTVDFKHFPYFMRPSIQAFTNPPQMLELPNKNNNQMFYNMNSKQNVNSNDQLFFNAKVAVSKSKSKSESNNNSREKHKNEKHKKPCISSSSGESSSEMKSHKSKVLSKSNSHSRSKYLLNSFSESLSSSSDSASSSETPDNKDNNHDKNQGKNSNDPKARAINHNNKKYKRREYFQNADLKKYEEKVAKYTELKQGKIKKEQSKRSIDSYRVNADKKETYKYKHHSNFKTIESRSISPKSCTSISDFDYFFNNDFIRSNEEGQHDHLKCRDDYKNLCNSSKNEKETQEYDKTLQDTDISSNFFSTGNNIKDALIILSNNNLKEINFDNNELFMFKKKEGNNISIEEKFIEEFYKNNNHIKEEIKNLKNKLKGKSVNMPYEELNKGFRNVEFIDLTIEDQRDEEKDKRKRLDKKYIKNNSYHDNHYIKYKEISRSSCIKSKNRNPKSQNHNKNNLYSINSSYVNNKEDNKSSKSEISSREKYQRNSYYKNRSNRNYESRNKKENKLEKEYKRKKNTDLKQFNDNHVTNNLKRGVISLSESNSSDSSMHNKDRNSKNQDYQNKDKYANHNNTAYNLRKNSPEYNNNFRWNHQIYNTNSAYIKQKEDNNNSHSSQNINKNNLDEKLKNNKNENYSNSKDKFKIPRNSFDEKQNLNCRKFNKQDKMKNSYSSYTSKNKSKDRNKNNRLPAKRRLGDKKRAGFTQKEMRFNRKNYLNSKQLKSNKRNYDKNISNDNRRERYKSFSISSDKGSQKNYPSKKLSYLEKKRKIDASPKKEGKMTSPKNQSKARYSYSPFTKRNNLSRSRSKSRSYEKRKNPKNLIRDRNYEYKKFNRQEHNSSQVNYHVNSNLVDNIEIKSSYEAKDPQITFENTSNQVVSNEETINNMNCDDKENSNSRYKIAIPENSISIANVENIKNQSEFYITSQSFENLIDNQKVNRETNPGQSINSNITEENSKQKENGNKSHEKPDKFGNYKNEQYELKTVSRNSHSNKNVGEHRKSRSPSKKKDYKYHKDSDYKKSDNNNKNNSDDGDRRYYQYGKYRSKITEEDSNQNHHIYHNKPTHSIISLKSLNSSFDTKDFHTSDKQSFRINDYPEGEKKFNQYSYYENKKNFNKYQNYHKNNLKQLTSSKGENTDHQEKENEISENHCLINNKTKQSENKHNINKHSEIQGISNKNIDSSEEKRNINSLTLTEEKNCYMEYDHRNIINNDNEKILPNLNLDEEINRFSKNLSVNELNLKLSNKKESICVSNKNNFENYRAMNNINNNIELSTSYINKNSSMDNNPSEAIKSEKIENSSISTLANISTTEKANKYLDINSDLKRKELYTTYNSSLCEKEDNRRWSYRNSYYSSYHQNSKYRKNYIDSKESIYRDNNSIINNNNNNFNENSNYQTNNNIPSNSWNNNVQDISTSNNKVNHSEEKQIRNISSSNYKRRHNNDDTNITYQTQINISISKSGVDDSKNIVVSSLKDANNKQRDLQIITEDGKKKIIITTERKNPNIQLTKN